MIERQFLMKSTAMMSTAMQIARIASPAADGIIFGFYGAIVSSVFVCTFLSAVFVYWFLDLAKIIFFHC